MAEAAEAAGLPEGGFEALLDEVATDPDRAFEDMRELLFDASMALFGCEGVSEAVETLGRFDAHRFGPLLHHYELSTWILYTRAFTSRVAPAICPEARAIDEALRAAPSAVAWLEEAWLGSVVARSL